MFRKKKQDPKALLNDALGEFELPSFPGAVMKTLQLLRDPNSGSPHIARSIEMNPALVVRLLKMVNSAAFGLRRKINSVSHAVTLLGRSRLESIVVGLAVRTNLPRHSGIGFQHDRFWTAAARRAAVARGLAGLLHPQTQSEAFVGGLLQDMALPLLAKVRPKQYAPILEHWHGEADSKLDELERTEFGWDHGEVGASMAHKWELPEVLINSIDVHHDTSDEQQAGVDPAIRLVSCIREMDQSPGVQELVEVCRDDYNLAPDTVVSHVRAAWGEAAELAALLR